nr:hypothetical protein Iba_chr05eCG6250 [Ipomoea batatas]
MESCEAERCLGNWKRGPEFLSYHRFQLTSIFFRIVPLKRFSLDELIKHFTGLFASVRDIAELYTDDQRAPDPLRDGGSSSGEERFTPEEADSSGYSVSICSAGSTDISKLIMRLFTHASLDSRTKADLRLSDNLYS